MSLRSYMFLNSMNPVGATCGRLQIHSKLKTGEHSSPLRYNTKIQLLVTVDLLSFNGRSKPQPYCHNQCGALYIITAFAVCFLIPQSFFVPQKMTAPFTREPMLDSRKGCSYGCANILISYQPKIIIKQRQYNGGSKPPPYRVGYIFQFVRFSFTL